MLSRRKLLVGAALAAPAIIIPKSVLGAVPTAMTTAAVNAAIASLAGTGGNVWLQPGVLDLSTGPIIGASNVTVHGVRGATIFRIPWHMLLSFYAVNALGCDEFHIRDVTFDMGDIDPPDDNWPASVSGVALFGNNGVSGGADCSFVDCKIINMGRYCVVARGGTRNLKVNGNTIIRTAPSGQPNIAIMLRKDGGAVNVTPEIIGNHTINTCGFCGASWNGILARNIMRGSGFGSNLCLDQDPNCADNIVSNNECSGMVSLPPGGGGNGIEVWSVRTLVTGNKTNDNIGDGLVIAERDCLVIGHMSRNNSATGLRLYGPNSGGGGNGHNTFVTGVKTLANGVAFLPDPSVVGTVLGTNDFR